MVPHWCTRCGTERIYVDSGGFEVYIRCQYCGEPTRYSASKYEVVCSLESQSRHLALQIGGLVGLENIEDIADEKTFLATIDRWKEENSGR